MIMNPEILFAIFFTLGGLDVSGVIASIVLIGTLIGIYIKQVKDVQEIKLTMKRDKEDTDKEITLLKIQLESQSKIYEKILSNLNNIIVNQAVFDEKLTQALLRLEKQEKNG